MSWFGEPIHFSGDPDDDDHVISRKVEDVKKTLGGLIHHGLEAREAIFW